MDLPSNECHGFLNEKNYPEICPKNKKKLENRENTGKVGEFCPSEKVGTLEEFSILLCV